MSAARAVILAGVLAALSSAHVGSPDVFFQGNAGPYPLLISIRPPDVIPGVARVEVRALGGGVQRVQLTPTPMTGLGAEHPPAADEATPSPKDPRYFEGALWLMAPGSWEVRIRVEGQAGAGEIPVPVPALALKTRPMDRMTTWFLLGMLIFLTTGLVAIVGAAVREAQLAPGVESRWTPRSLGWMAGTAVIVAVALWSGWNWWGSDAATYARKIYKPLNASATIAENRQLELRIEDPGWLPLRKLDDLVPDHGHLMHLFLLRWPSMDYVFHLHPEQIAPGFFSLSPPSLPAGNYKLFADIVHENGFAESAIGVTSLPSVSGVPLGGDDAGGAMNPPRSSIVWNNRPANIRANQPTLFSFSILDPTGKPYDDLESYMGMGGHAEFVKEDGTVFAHLHPSGSISMASMAVASRDAMRAMHQSSIGPAVSFPYGLPSPGDYRVFVQMKRAGKVETGAFRFHVG